MWDFDRSAARGMMACRGLYVFSHASKLGEAPAHQLFRRIEVQLRDGVDVPRSIDHYSVSVDDDNLPDGVVLSRLME